jgi:hypothetical protein
MERFVSRFSFLVSMKELMPKSETNTSHPPVYEQKTKLARLMYVKRGGVLCSIICHPFHLIIAGPPRKLVSRRAIITRDECIRFNTRCLTFSSTRAEHQTLRFRLHWFSTSESPFSTLPTHDGGIRHVSALESLMPLPYHRPLTRITNSLSSIFQKSDMRIPIEE